MKDKAAYVAVARVKLRAAYPGAVVLVRVWDTYLASGIDACIASQQLSLPMDAQGYVTLLAQHINRYVSRLRHDGYRVVLSDQPESSEIQQVGY